MEKKYVPQPMDTTDVQLPEELNALIEQMSKNVHEVWAESRIEQGWSYGEERSDALKTHPCLIPYEELPEVEYRRLLMVLSSRRLSDHQGFSKSR